MQTVAASAGERRGRRASDADQPLLPLPAPAKRGGARPGAGRKPAVGRRPTPHRARPPHAASHPVHVTLRSALRSLRDPCLFPAVRGAISAVNRERRAGPIHARRLRQDFRVVHFSVQGDHIHLIVEARDARALSNALRGLSVSIARRVNALLRRSGRMFADRWYGRALATPRAVRHAIVYVLANHKKHRSSRAAFDPCSSAPYFDGFRELRGRIPIELEPRCVPRALAPPDGEGRPAILARTWLLSVGWRKAGAISVADAPRSASIPAADAPRRPRPGAPG